MASLYWELNPDPQLAFVRYVRYLEDCCAIHCTIQANRGFSTGSKKTNPTPVERGVVAYRWRAYAKDRPARPELMARLFHLHECTEKVPGWM